MRSLILFPVIFLLFAGIATGSDNFLLTGQIVDTANRPISGAEVYVFDSTKIKRPADFISNRTTENGYYKVELPRGRYWAVAIMRQSGSKFGPLGRNDKHSGEPVEIISSEKPTITHDFMVMDLQEAAKINQKRNETIVRITGQVLDKNGNPTSMAYVMADLHQQFGRMPRYLSTWTDDDGNYVLFLPAGKYFIGASKDFPPNSDYILQDNIAIDSDTTSIDLVVDDARRESHKP